ncbi:hypothetical protein HY991_04320 [Candidatus Micrarchaeota archaeon]|nr:hypothetical protein [Candidatus Micrarchaeota archaeon]
MRKVFVKGLLLFLALLSPVIADKVLLLDFDVTRNGKVDMNWLSVIEGKPDASSKGSYAAIVLDREGNTISKTKFSISFYLSETFEELDKRTILMKVPYREDAYNIQIQKNEKTVFQQLIGSVCNRNLKCEKNENYASCPTDCVSGSRDNYCDGIADGKCDPDCASSGDEDCIKAGAKSTEVPPWLIPGTVVLIVVVAAAGLLYLKRKKKPATHETAKPVTSSPKPKK